MKKRILALSAALLMITRVIVLDTYAASGVIVAEEAIGMLSELLLGTGHYTQEQINGMSLDDMKLHLNDEIDIGTINVNAVRGTLPDWYHVANPSSLALQGLYNFLDNSEKLGEDIYDHFHPTYSRPDLNGHASMVKIYFGNRNSWDIDRYKLIYSDKPGERYLNGDKFGAYYIQSDGFEYIYNLRDEFQYSMPCGSYTSDYRPETVELYGTWIWREDGRPADTNDEKVPAIGEINGIPITPDMVNPDGTVNIDGTTYDPDDYVDIDKITDDGILELLRQILDILDKYPVVEQDKDTAGDIVGDTSIDLDISELNNLVVPPVISDVFPFCLPFDFYKGLRLLASNPVPPRFEIPFYIPAFGLFEGSENTITLDMAEYSKYFEVGRWVQVVLFMISLCFVSFKVVKGVH